ncbi:MAG: class I SAM-dependent methyltransferase [Bacteroidaceae bacterium]|nr:class I SAM-dependent methyltransferase [Bacteroidaceae bacterium]
MALTLDDYVVAHSSAEHPYLHALYRATHTQLVRPRMASGQMQGQLLRMLAQLIAPQTVVEIGTYSGYSALAMASGMPAGSALHTFEINDEQEDFTRPWLEGSPWSQSVDIRLHIGDIFALLPPMGLRLDLVFVDANKRDYCDYYDLVMPMLRVGGYLIADNTLWDGHVVDPERCDPQTEGIRAFNTRVADDARVEQVILPIRDGLTLIRKISD